MSFSDDIWRVSLFSFKYWRNILLIRDEFLDKMSEYSGVMPKEIVKILGYKSNRIMTHKDIKYDQRQSHLSYLMAPSLEIQLFPVYVWIKDNLVQSKSNCLEISFANIKNVKPMHIFNNLISPCPIFAIVICLRSDTKSSTVSCSGTKEIICKFITKEVTDTVQDKIINEKIFSCYHSFTYVYKLCNLSGHKKEK